MVTTYGRDAELLPEERVSWPASPPVPASIAMFSRRILGGHGDRPELAAAHNGTTVAALISIFVVATTKCCLL